MYIDDQVSRRRFLAATAAGGAGLLAGRLEGLWGLAPGARAGSGALTGAEAPWIEATFTELQRLMQSGELSSVELTRGYLRRIERLNPLLHAIIETNPAALRIAERLDAERRRGDVRGPLHGIPILLKDNIATADAMETTAGSLALVGSRVPQHARLVQKLRFAGAVILGKTNLSEWANFRGFPPADFPFETNFLNGWSARGGFSLNPYLLSFDPCGSSAGSATAVAANLGAASIGTETDGSIICPAGNNLIVGLKPTVGLIPADGIIPIAHSQDSAGPMTRTVEDTAILMNVLSRTTFRGVRTPDFTTFLDPHALRGARIGVERRLFEPEYFGVPEIVAVLERAMDAMRAAGAVLVDPVDTGDVFAWGEAEFLVLLYEFKGDIERYLAGLSGTSMRTLSDLIRFNIEHCEQEMKYFGQEIFEIAEDIGGDLTDRDYRDARALALRLARDEGIDRVMREHRLDAVISPSFGAGSTAPAVAGYPVISVPIGIASNGWPAGAWLYAGAGQESNLIAIGYAMEQLLQPRTQPRLRGEEPPEPPDAGICSAQIAGVASTRSADLRALLEHRGRGHIMPGR
jgi:amidase